MAERKIGTQAEGAEGKAALISVGRLPRVREDLESLRGAWERKALDAARMVCAEDDVQGVKALRAALRREFEAADAQRRAAKARYMAPWDEVERVWDACVEGPFRRADGAYREAVEGCDEKLRARSLAALREFYAALQAEAGLEWLPLERALEAGEVKLSPGRLRAGGTGSCKKQLEKLAERVKGETERIAGLENAAAVMAEYRLRLDLGQAVATVQERRRREREEEELLDRAANGGKAPARYTVTLIGADRAQLRALRSFLRGEGIRFE